MTRAPRPSADPIRIGALAPLSPPGWVAAGRQLLAGMMLAARHVNDSGGIHGRTLELVVRDTAADPETAVTAVDELARAGVAAVAGEYHSVVARAVAQRADALGVPFLCSSAVLDGLIDHPADRLARIAPAQSHGWRIYAEYLIRTGHRHIAVAMQPSVYWAAGTRILRDHLAVHGGTVTEIVVDARRPAAVCDALAAGRATAVLLLAGHPEPVVPLLRAIRRDRRLPGITVGAPAGQPELDDWAPAVGADGTGVPFLRYLPARLTRLGQRVCEQLRRDGAAEPSFVAYEGYDTVAVLTAVLREHGPEREAIGAGIRTARVVGTRGLIEFGRPHHLPFAQWSWAPVQVVDRDPDRPDRFRVLHQE